MATLKELVQQKLEVTDLEDIPEDVLRDTLEGIDGTLSEKIDAIAGLLEDWKGKEAVIAAEMDRLRKRKSVFAKRTERLKAYLTWNLGRLNQKTVETALHTVSWRKGQDRVVVDELGFLTNDYIVTEVKPDKAAIKADLKAGKDIPGAHLEKGQPFVVVK